MKRLRIFAIGAGLVIIAGLMLAHVLARPAPATAYVTGLPDRRPLVIGHADDSGLGLVPGNTLAHLERMADLGVDVLDVDLHLSSDGQVVLIHDGAVDRTTNGSGQVSDMTLAELQALDAGYRWTTDGGATFPFRGQGYQIATLADALERFPDWPMVMEIKQETPSMAQALCQVLRDHGATQRVIVPSSREQALADFRAACPEVATAAGTNEVTWSVGLSMVGLGGVISPAYAAAQVPLSSSGIPVVTPGWVSAMHSRGVKVDVWTIDDPAEMQRLIDLGVDAIFTNRPDVLLKLLGR
jgi:glycerophosphoryl diester phosphodiesterase